VQLDKWLMISISDYNEIQDYKIFEHNIFLLTSLEIITGIFTDFGFFVIKSTNPLIVTENPQNS
jgi:hypothetical protein